MDFTDRFGLVPFSVGSDGALSHGAVRSYWVLSMDCNQNKECLPKQELIAQIVGVSRKRIPVLIEELRRRGHVVTRRTPRGLVYFLPELPDSQGASPGPGPHPLEQPRRIEAHGVLTEAKGSVLDAGRDPAAASEAARATGHGFPERGDRSRLICKAIFDNPDIGELGPIGIALYVGLIVLADDYGKLEVDWRRIWALLFPYTPAVDVEGTARLLADRGVIELYQVCAKTYVRHPDWFVYQKLRRPRPTVIPDPDGIVRHLQRTNRFGDVAFDQPMTPAGAAPSPPDRPAVVGRSSPSTATAGAGCGPALPPELQEVGSTAPKLTGAQTAARAPSSPQKQPAALAGTLPPVADRRAPHHDGDPPRACMVSCDPDLTDAAVRVYWVMARHSDHEGRCVIGLSDIAAMAFKVVEQIPALIDQLRRRGHVVTRKAGAGLAYFLPGVPDFARVGNRLPLNGGHP